MKHNSLISANGLFHYPLASTTIKSSFLTAIFKPLLLLFLLVMGSSVVWARPTIYGEGLPGLNASGASNWDSNTKEMSAYGEANTYYAEFLNVAATDNNKYRFKIAVNSGGDWWSGAMDSNNVNEGMGNVDIVAGNETQISFKMPFDGDVYIFYKSTNADNSKVWIVAVPQNVAAAPNNSGNRRLKTDIMLSGSGWTSEGIKYAKNNDATTYKHVTSYILPATHDNDERDTKIRFEMYYNDNCYVSGKSTGARMSTSTPQRIIYLWNGDNGGAWIAYTLPTYPVRKSGWKLFIDGYNSGNATNLDANGEATVTLSGGSTYQFFIANTDQATTVSSYSSDIKSYPAVHGVNCFGGCYIDQNNSSNVSFTNREVYDHNKSGYGWFRHPVVAAQDLRGEFQVSGSGTKDVTFNFDGGKITINAVDHADVGPKYTVTLHPNNGGSDIVRENVPEGSNSSAAALNLAAVTYGVGTATWYTNSECTAPFSTVTGNMDLYAKWGVNGNYYVVGDLWMYNSAGDWDNNKGQLMTNTNGVCTVTYTAPKGLNRFEIIKDKEWGQKINGGTYSAVINASSPIPLSVSDGHIVFTLTEAKQVTITFDGKVSVSATDYSFNQTVDWRVKTSNSGWGNVPNSWDHSNVMTKTASGASIIIQNVPANIDHSFMITRGSDEQAAVGTYNFNALWLDTSNPSSGLTWNMQNTNIGDRQLAQTDNEWRNCSFRLSAQSDLRITFDGGKIRCDIVAPNTVTFNSNGGSAVASQEVSNGGTASEPSAPTKDGYTFVKWQLNGSDYNFSNPVTGNITLDATWAYKAISSVVLNESTHMTWVGNSDFALTPTLTPSDAIAKSVAWSSNNNSVATVSNGTVHAVSAGTATITYTVTDQFDHPETATCEVTVAACEMATDNIYSMTVTGYNSSTGSSATLSGLWNESTDNDGPASMTICNIRIGNNGGSNEYYAYDNNGTVMIEQRSSEDVDKWYMIDAGTNLYYLKNVSTGKYMYCGPTNTSGSKGNGWTGNGDWFLRSIYTSTSNGETDSYKFYRAKDDWNNDVIVSRADASMGAKATATDFVLSRQQLTGTPGVWNDVVPNTVSASRGAEQGGNAYKGFQSAFVNIENVPNPAYLASQMNTSYYRMKENATVRANLAAPLVSGAEITVRLYADAATTVKLQKTDGTEIETINLTAGAEREYTYTGSALVGESAFVIKATDNHAGIASIVVTRTYAAHPSSPALAWETDLTGGVMQSVSGGTFQHIASSTLSSGAIHYISSDETVATVASNGTVTPLTDGTTTITATIEAEGCYAEASITYNVMLTESTLAELIETTSEGGTLTLNSNYNEDAIIDKAITINAQGHSIRDLKVEQSGDLTLSSELTVRDFTICAKAGNTTTSAASGQVRNATNLTCSRNAYFLYTVDPSGHVQYGWYDFTVPFPVNAASGIKGIQAGVMKENFAYGPDYAIMDYNGAKQAQGQYPYKKFSGVMQPNKLYSITLDNDFNYNTLRMQKTAEGDLVAGDDVTLEAHDGDELHKNWNGVGNGTLHHADAGISGNYIQVYQSGDKTFLTVNKNDYSFVVGTAFMVQVQEAGTMTLNQATHSQLLAPARQASAPATAIQIAREGQPFSDQLFITASETGGQAYTPGSDLAKAGDLGSANVPQIWTNAYNSPLCVHEAQLINGEAQYNLSLYAPAAGSYTLTSLNIPADYSLYLTQDGTMLGELNGTYTLDLNKGITTKYGLLLVETYKTPTGIEEISNQPSVFRKILHNGVLYILHNGKIYNAQGAKVK